MKATQVKNIYKHLKKCKNYKSGKQIEKDIEILMSDPAAELSASHLFSDKVEEITLYLDNKEEDIRIVMTFRCSRTIDSTPNKETTIVSYTYLTGYSKEHEVWAGDVYLQFRMENMFSGIPAEIYREIL